MITLILYRDPSDRMIYDVRTSDRGFVRMVPFGRMTGLSGFRADIILVQDDPTNEERQWLMNYALHRAGPDTKLFNCFSERVNISYFAVR